MPTRARSKQPEWVTSAQKGCGCCVGTVFTGTAGQRLLALARAAPQLPALAVLLFNVAASAVCHLGTQLLFGKQKLADGETPPLLSAGYRYPAGTRFAWALCGAFACWRIVRATLGLPPLAPLAVAAAAAGAWLALRRLASWRAWVRDFFGEAFRVIELRMLDGMVAEAVAASAAAGATPARILDFGAGKGLCTKHILRQHDAETVGVEAIDIVAAPPHVREYDGQSIPFDPASFDLAVALYVLHHIPATRRMLVELRRVVRHGGRVLIFEDLPKETSQPLLASLFFGAHFLAFKQDFHTHLDRSRAEWRALLKEVGFRVVREFEVPPSTAIPYKRVGLLAE